MMVKKTASMAFRDRKAKKQVFLQLSRAPKKVLRRID